MGSYGGGIRIFGSDGDGIGGWWRCEGRQLGGRMWRLPAKVYATVIAAKRGDGTGRIWSSSCLALTGRGVITLLSRTPGDVWTLIVIAGSPGGLVQRLFSITWYQCRQCFNLCWTLVYVDSLDQLF